MKTILKLQTQKGYFEIPINLDKYQSSSNKNYGDEDPLTQLEISAIRQNIRDYPTGGLGECLIRCNSKRGWKRHPGYSKFTTSPAPIDSFRCPVVLLKEMSSEKISFSQHLRQFRRIRNHIAIELGISIKDARFFYNYMLANRGTELAGLI